MPRLVLFGKLVKMNWANVFCLQVRDVFALFCCCHGSLAKSFTSPTQVIPAICVRDSVSVLAHVSKYEHARFLVCMSCVSVC